MAQADTFISSLLVVWALKLPPSTSGLPELPLWGPGSGQRGGPGPSLHTPLFGAHVLVLRLLRVQISIVKVHISSFSS